MFSPQLNINLQIHREAILVLFLFHHQPNLNFLLSVESNITEMFDSALDSKVKSFKKQARC